jgi:tetratricopeptide (TPR) repeat protein
MPVFVTERYRIAAVPGLMILAAAGLWIFGESVARSRWSTVGLYLVLCAGAAWFVSIPRADIGLWSLDHYKAGIRATSAGELELKRQNPAGAAQAFDRAQGNLEKAYDYVPNNADIDFAMGNLWLARSTQPSDDAQTKNRDITRAKLFYRLAFELNPRHTGTLNNLGVLAMEEKRWKLAQEFFKRAIDSEPDDAKTYYLLARAFMEDGQTGPARDALDGALRLRPNQKQFLELRDQLNAPAPKPPAQ